MTATPTPWTPRQRPRNALTAFSPHGAAEGRWLARKIAAVAEKRMLRAARDRLPRLTDDLLASFDRREADQFALMSWKDRDRVIATVHPDLAPAVRKELAERAVTSLWNSDPRTRVARYATAMRALQARGSSRAAAGRHLGISPSWTTLVGQRSPHDVVIAPDDYLHDLLASWPNH